MFRNAGIVCKNQSTSEKLIYSVKECPPEWRRVEKAEGKGRRGGGGGGAESSAGCDIA